MQFTARFGKTMAAYSVVAFLFLFAGRTGAQNLSGGLPDKKSGKASAEKKKLLQTKLLPLAQKIAKIAMADYQVGKSDVQTIYRWSKRIMEIEYQLAEKKEKKKDAVKGHLDRLKSSLQSATARYRVGKTGQTDVLILQYFIAEAEFRVMQESKNKRRE